VQRFDRRRREIPMRLSYEDGKAHHLPHNETS